jgi:phosphoribosyl-AMP cyclohydrolase
MAVFQPAPDQKTLLEKGNVLSPRFDAHGLVTAVAVEESTNLVLTVAHMNEEALAKTLETGKVHYYSRSRQKLWMKGETSGQIQTVQDIYVDCDQDALVLKVIAKGPACHNGYKSCFYRKIEGLNGRAEDASLTIVDQVMIDPETLYHSDKSKA